MDKQHIKKTSNALYKKLYKSITAATANFNINNIHQCRVHYKKLRAFLKLVSQQQNGINKISCSRKIKKLYSLLGKIRDLQLQQQRLRSIPKFPQQLNWYRYILYRQINHLKNELSLQFKEKKLLESKQKTDAALPEKLPAGHIRNFLLQKQIGIHALIATKHFSDTAIHAIRKQLKDLFYIVSLHPLSGKQLFVNTKWETKKRAYFDNLLDKLGIFQDSCTAIALLHTHRLNNPGQTGLLLLKKIQQTWAIEKNALKKLLTAELKNF